MDSVRIFTINDTHGAFYNDDNVIGLEKVETLIKSLESSHGPYIKIANGDILQGAYVSNVNYGRPFIDVFNAMNFHAFVIGNHEFDWGIEKIAEYADGNLENAEANFPFLASNIVYSATQLKLPWTQDYVIVENNGYRVGLIGAMGYGLESAIDAQKVAGYSFLDPVPIAAALSLELRTIHHCDVVVVAIHGYSQATNLQMAALSGNNRIDAIVCAHTHQQIATFVERSDGYQIPVMQSLAKNNSVGAISLHIEDNVATHATITHYNPYMYADDPDIINVIALYAEDITEANTIIGYTVEHLYHYRLGTEMVNAIKERFDVNVAIMNTGGVRAQIGVGNIAIKHVYEVFPFNNKVILTNILGNDLIRLFNDHSGYLYFSQGFNVTLINPSATYSFAVIDFVFINLYYSHYFSHCTELVETNILMRDVFIDYIEDYYS